MGNKSKGEQGTLPTMGEDVTGTRFSALTYGEQKELAREQSDAFLMGTYLRNFDELYESEMGFAIDEVLTERGLAHDTESTDWRDTSDRIVEDMAYQIRDEDDSLYTTESWNQAIDEFMQDLYTYDNDELADLMVDPASLRVALESYIEE